MVGEYQGLPLGGDSWQTQVPREYLAQARTIQPRASQEHVLRLRQADTHCHFTSHLKYNIPKLINPSKTYHVM